MRNKKQNILITCTKGFPEHSINSEVIEKDRELDFFFKFSVNIILVKIIEGRL